MPERMQPVTRSLFGLIFPAKPPMIKQLIEDALHSVPTQPPWPISKTSHLELALQREQHSATFSGASIAFCFGIATGGATIPVLKVSIPFVILHVPPHADGGNGGSGEGGRSRIHG